MKHCSQGLCMHMVQRVLTHCFNKVILLFLLAREEVLASSSDAVQQLRERKVKDEWRPETFNS